MSGNPSEDGSPSRKHRVSTYESASNIPKSLDAFLFGEVSGISSLLSAISE